jgi:hypothetical protein
VGKGALGAQWPGQGQGKLSDRREKRDHGIKNASHVETVLNLVYEFV